MKKYVIILVLIGFWGCEEEVENISIVGAWTLSEVCIFENENSLENVPQNIMIPQELMMLQKVGLNLKKAFRCYF